MRKISALGSFLATIVSIETNYRFIVYGNYVVFYQYDNGGIYVDRVLYSRRDSIKILFGETKDNV